MAFIREIRKKSGIYLAEVEGHRIDGKVRQKVIRYLGKKIDGKPEKRILKSEVQIKEVKRSLDVLAVDTIVKELGIHSLQNKHALALIYSQVLEKYSINQLEEWLRFTEIPSILGIGKISTKSLYESLGEIDEKEVNAISQKLHEFFAKHDDSTDIAVIDVTDTYFAGTHETIKRRKGKDSKIKKLIQVALAVSFKQGFPILHKIYHGNLSNIHIFKDMALELKFRKLNGIIVDRGMMGEDNLMLTKKLGFKVITGFKKTTTIEGNYLSKIKREDLYSLNYRIALKNTTVFATNFEYNDGTLIVVYNPALEFIKKEHRFEKGKNPSDPYIGFSLIYHNTSYSTSEIVRQYYEKEIIERAFKQLKGVLSLRPIRVWLKNHIEAHIHICYLAYAILTYMNYRLRKTNVSAVEALRSLKQGYRVTLTANKEEWNLHVPLEPKQQKLLDAIGVVYKK